MEQAAGRAGILEKKVRSESPPASPSERRPRPAEQVFIATLSRESRDAPWGLLLDYTDNRTAHVSGILGGRPVLEYNASADDGAQLKPGDYIVEVNGISAVSDLEGKLLSQQLERELERCSNLALAVRRPQFFECTIDKGDEPLGLDLDYTGQCTSLIIGGVPDSSFLRCAPEVRAGDRIVAVNGVVGQAGALLRALEGSSSPVLTISRPA